MDLKQRRINVLPNRISFAGILLALCVCALHLVIPCVLQAQQPTKEYIRLNGKLVAIESLTSGDFSVAAPNSLTIVQGGTTTLTVTVTPSSGFSGSVALSILDGLPTGVTSSFSPATVTLTSGAVTSTLTLTAAANATSGTTTLRVAGTVGSVVRNSSTTLTTTAPFTLGGLSDLSIAAGTSGTRTLTVTAAGGFTGSVNLSVSGLPSGVTAGFSVNPVVGGSGSSVITFTAASGAALGTSTVTVTGTNATSGFTGSITMAITITAGASYTLGAPSGGTVTAGTSGSFAVTVSVTGGYNAPITFGINSPVTGVTATFTPSSLSGAGTVTMNLAVGAAVSPGSYTITIQGTSTINRSSTFTLTVIAAQQSLNSASISPSNGLETQISVTATDPLGASHISAIELHLSNSRTSNSYPSQMACRFITRRTASGFTISLLVRDGSSNTTYETQSIGSTGSINNGACAINLSQTTVTQSGNNLSVSVRVGSAALSGTFYLRGITQKDASGSEVQPFSYLAADWNPPAASTATFSNSQGVTPPVLYSGYSVSVTMTGANLGTNVMSLRLVQTNDGTASTSGTNPITLNYVAGNSGQDRDVLLQGLICTSNPCTEGNALVKYNYTIRVQSSTSSPPSLDFTNPFTGTTLNPSPINGDATANGTTATFISFGIKNYPYPAGQCTYYPYTLCTPIQSFYLNINRTFTESSLAQDRSGGCRLRISVAAGSNPTYYGMYLMNDAGDGESGINWTPSAGGGTLSNSQCSLNFASGSGSYAYWPYNDNTFLGVGISYTFQSSFLGRRHVFMMGNRNNGDWTGWQYRGYLNLQ